MFIQFLVNPFLVNIGSILLLFGASLAIRAVLIAAGQLWIKTYAHTLSLSLLPIITFVISSVISGNIALSLGMVGALSIVRFRNPVKSPFELVVFFLYITMGIAASVSLVWMMGLVVAVTAILLGFNIADRDKIKATGQGYFQASFSEGNELPTVEIEARSPLSDLLTDAGLMSYSVEDGKYNYVIASKHKQAVLDLAEAHQSHEAVNFVRYSSY